jgi:hypothetical protein
VPEATFDLVDPLSCLLETANNLWNIIWIAMSKAELSITVIFTHSVYKTLYTNEKSKIVTTTDSANLNLAVEGHLYWNTILLT